MNKVYIVLALAVALCVIDSCYSVPISSSEDERNLENTENCKNLCEHCGCMGFYCGDECICECNNQEDEGKHF